MVKVILLPDNVVLEIGGSRVKVKEILKAIGESSFEYVTILVNDKLSEDLELEVSNNDRVVVIKQPTGG